MTERPRTTLVALAAAVIAFLASRSIEHTYSRLARPKQAALEWISDIPSLDLGSKPQADAICIALMSLARRRRNGSGADEAEQDDRTVVAFVIEDAAA